MTPDRMIELNQWADKLERERPVNQAIDAVKDRMRGETEDVVHYLAFDLKNMLIRAERYTEAEQVIGERMRRRPDDVRFPIARAGLYLYFIKDSQRALDAIEEALARARRTGFFRREAMGVKARVLLELGQGDLLSQTLEEIMELRVTRDIPDIGKERDFVDRAPAGLVSEEVLARYNEFCPPKDVRG